MLWMSVRMDHLIGCVVGDVFSGLDNRTPYLKPKERRNYNFLFKSMNYLIVYSNINEIGSSDIITSILFVWRIVSYKHQGRIRT